MVLFLEWGEINKVRKVLKSCDSKPDMVGKVENTVQSQWKRVSKCFSTFCLI